MSRRRILQKALETQSFEKAIGDFHTFAVENGWLPKQELRGLVDLMEKGIDQSSGFGWLYTHSIVKLLAFCPPVEFTPLVSRVLRACLDSNQPEHTLGLMRAIQIANTGQIQIEYATLEKLMLTAKYLGDVDFAWSAIKTMQLHYTNLYSRTWGLFLSLVLDQNNYPALEYIWKEAAIPGYLILDDHSYTQMARIASQNMNMEMCSWAVLGITERHKFHGHELTNFTLLQVYLIEAVTGPKPSNRQTQKAISAACRYIVQMQDTAASVSTQQLPNLLELLKNPVALEYFKAMFQQMIVDPGAYDMVKLLFFNILLCRSNPDTQLRLYHLAREHGIALNDESTIMFIELAKELADGEFLRQVVGGKMSLRVQERYKRALQAIG